MATAYTHMTDAPPRGVDPQELDGRIAEMHRDLANEAHCDLRSAETATIAEVSK